MCGIFGAIGTTKALDHVIEGLTRLEYRGYDSAGVAIGLENGELTILKEVGKIVNLKRVLKDKQFNSQIAIGHTRWATHGPVCRKNAHPHGKGDFAIIHNGIIENATEIKNSLSLEGYEFVSDTDTEVFLGLLNSLSRSDLSLEQLVGLAFKKIKGNSAIVVISKEMNKIVAVKRGAPLVFGQSSRSNEMYVSSDPYALMGLVEQFIFPSNEVVGVLSPELHSKIEFYDLDGNKSESFTVKKSDMQIKVNDKGDFEHFMLKEIYEQPSLIRNLAESYEAEQLQQQISQLLNDYRPSKIHIVACGTAWHAGLIIKRYIEKRTGIPTDVDLASEFRYRDPILSPNDLGLFISQSGETADTLGAQQLCREKGLRCYSVINVEGSSLFRNSDYNFLINAGQEVGVASTKAFSLQVLTGYFISHLWGNNKELSSSLLSEVNLLADLISSVLDRDSEIRNMAEKLYRKKGFIFTGRGINFPVALEGALKLKEITYVHAEGLASGELKHGPIALIDENMVNMAFIGNTLTDKTLSNIEEVKARRGIIVGVGPSGLKHSPGLFDYYFPIDYTGPDELYPLLLNIVSQLFAYHMARYKGTDIDRPRNLAKSVTVE